MLLQHGHGHVQFIIINIIIITTTTSVASLYDGQEVFVWSDCQLDLCTDFLVGIICVVSCGTVIIIITTRQASWRIGQQRSSPTPVQHLDGAPAVVPVLHFRFHSS